MIHFTKKLQCGVLFDYSFSDYTWITWNKNFMCTIKQPTFSGIMFSLYFLISVHTCYYGKNKGFEGIKSRSTFMV